MLAGTGGQVQPAYFFVGLKLPAQTPGFRILGLGFGVERV